MLGTRVARQLLWAAHVEVHTCCVCGHAPKVEMIEQESAIKVYQDLCAQQGQTASSGACRQMAPCTRVAGNIQKLYATVALHPCMRLKDKLHVG